MTAVVVAFHFSYLKNGTKESETGAYKQVVYCSSVNG